MRNKFRDAALELAEHDKDVCVILGDVSVYLFQSFKDKFEDRLYNMGICENSLISVAAGMSSRGLKPFVHTIAPFLTERSIEQIKIDACYNAFPINIVTCGASFDYSWDGATHHCLSDLENFRMLPNTEVMQPGSEKEAEDLIKSRYNSDVTSYFRLSDNPHSTEVDTTFGVGTVLKDENANYTVVTSGPILKNVLPAVSELNVNLLYFHTLKPIDERLLDKYRDTKFLVVCDAFGLFETICDVLQGASIFNLVQLNKFAGCYGQVDDARNEYGLTVEALNAKIRSLIE